jgi:hypothetical protein
MGAYNLKYLIHHFLIIITLLFYVLKTIIKIFMAILLIYKIKVLI